jgi:hypothetical protein
MDAYKRVWKIFHSILLQRKWQAALSLLFVLVVTVLAFYNVLDANFVNWDDKKFLG